MVRYIMLRWFVLSYIGTCACSAQNLDTVKLNVGGEIREVGRATADKLSWLADKLQLDCPADQPVFIDANPQVFDLLLEVARVGSFKFLAEIGHPLKELVHTYSKRFGIEITSGHGFDFRLTARHPANSAIINQYSYISNSNSQCTTGVRHQWNTVFGDTQIPKARPTYWEVEVLSLGFDGLDFMVGVVDTSFKNANSFLDSSKLGWGIYHRNGGRCSLRGDSSDLEDISGRFPIYKGMRLGTLVDVDRGSLMFFLDGYFKLSHPMSIKDRVLFPALSILGATELAIRTNLPAPL